MKLNRKVKLRYSSAINLALRECLVEFPDLVVMGQGITSPFYVGNTMKGLKEEFSDRLFDTPVSENAVTAMALGIAVAGSKSLVIHPRMDFMILAADAIVNSIAKWRSSLALDIPIPLVIRAILNRGGGQGAQHSQALYSWFAHVPGLRVVAPSSPGDAYRMLKQALSGKDPVIFVEDRWDYEMWGVVSPEKNTGSLSGQQSSVIRNGSDVSLWGIGHTVNVALRAAKILEARGISCEVIDQKVLNPFECRATIASASKTGRLVVIENAWPVASIGSHLIASLAGVGNKLIKPPLHLSLPAAAAPVSQSLENNYYCTVDKTVNQLIAYYELP